MQDEEVSRYMCWKASDDITKTKEFIQQELEQIENDKWNRWIIVLKESGNKSGLSAHESDFDVYGQTKAKKRGEMRQKSLPKESYFGVYGQTKAKRK